MGAGERISVKYLFRDYTEPQEAGLSAIDEGKLLHEIFKSIRYVDEVEQAVGKAYLGGLIKRDEKEKYVAKISTFLGVPQASEWFAPSCKVMNERDILFPGGQKPVPTAWWRGKVKFMSLTINSGKAKKTNTLSKYDITVRHCVIWGIPEWKDISGMSNWEKSCRYDTCYPAITPL